MTDDSSSSSSSNNLEERRVIRRFRIEDAPDRVTEFSYSVFQDGTRYEKAYINVCAWIKADENNHNYITTLLDFDSPSEAMYYHCLAEYGFYSRNKYLKRVHLIDLDRNPVIVLVDEIKGFYDEWCEREYDYFQNSENMDEARCILNKFITILRKVVEGLISLFKEGKYHGNLTDGIEVDDDLNVSFYNMRKIGNDNENSEDGIAEDIEDVHDMISIWLSREDEFEESRLLRHFQEKLENKALMKDKNYIWGIDDPIFWSSSEKYDFVRALFNFMQFLDLPLPKSLENCFAFDWQSFVPEEENDPLRRTYSRMREWEEGLRSIENDELISFWDKALYKYNKYASQSGGEYGILSLDEAKARIEETFNMTQVCFSTVQCYLLQENMSDEDRSIKARLIAKLEKKSYNPWNCRF